MPRKLPWENVAASTSSRTNKPPAPKRQKTNKKDDRTPSPRRDTDERAPSSSPPPEAAKEEYMDEGIKKDDKWRMVEDELLTVAKTFTVHLHAAEYKRQQKMVKSRNAETINTISRPVAGKMPEHTKRKIEAASRVKTQRAALEDVIVKKAEEDDDSDDGDGLPYFGITLHGLMDSPRKKAASLAKPGTITTTTRAAAGFKKSAAQSRPNIAQESPGSRVAFRTAKTKAPNESTSEPSEDDDDLDAPIPAPKFGSALPVSSSSSTTKTATSLPVPQPSSLSTKSSSSSVVRPKQTYERLSPEFRPRPSRAEQSRRQKARLEKEQKDKQLLDVIPTFL